ncbi:MAG: ATP-grasp fold amidoligase family protein [Salinivirgaceae bacterium]
MDYKKIFRNRDLRIRILSLLDFIPDKWMIKLQYRIKFGRKLNLKNPQRFTEKLQWYKLYYRNPIMKQCADKYNIRNYIIEKGLGHILNELYGVYDKTEDIEFDKLPNQFVLKTTNGGGGLNIILCRDKALLDIEQTKYNLNKWLIQKQSKSGREWAYYDLKPRIIIERLMINKENPEAGINDYKFFCFNGEVKYVVVDIDRYIEHKRNFYDVGWNLLNIESDCPNFDSKYPKPKGFDKMLQVANELSSDFPFVRVDLYLESENPILGELTFYPWSGYDGFKPDEFDFELGKSFILKTYK